MPVELSQWYEKDRPQCVEFKLSEKLHRDDYAYFVPLFEELVSEHGKLRVLACLRNFHGWDLAALWEDLKFDLNHFSDIELLAVVGDQRWEKWMTTFFGPFTSAEVRYFDVADYEKAKEWVLNAEIQHVNPGTGLPVTPY